MSFLFMRSIVTLLFTTLTIVQCRRYQTHDRIDVIGNTVGPFNNPTETYPYFSLPFCERTGKQRFHRQGLGETLTGSRKVTTPYEVTFLDPVPWRALCEEYMETKEVGLKF